MSEQTETPVETPAAPVVEEAQLPEASSQELPEELNVEQSFNLMINLARQSKLTYDEHALVDKSVRVLAQALGLQ